MKTTRNKNYRPLNLQLVVEQAVCKQGSVLPMTQGAQLRSGGSDDERNFYITFLARSFVLRHMTVTSNEQGRRANDERRSCRSIVLVWGLSTYLCCDCCTHYCRGDSSGGGDDDNGMVAAVVILTAPSVTALLCFPQDFFSACAFSFHHRGVLLSVRCNPKYGFPF